MLNTLLAIDFNPGLRGIVVVLISVVVLIGGTYLVVGTNLGARLGFLVVLASFFGWMMTMGAIWWVYGIGLVAHHQLGTQLNRSRLLEMAVSLLVPKY